ncbi:imm11 family protein [Yoonia vestfoldensis]|uniref:imm11 family protein n=1 Tax=Yoonia vestfoldensis TaxID=245188 RepID=UPI00035D60F7|nr:hypothetical protein [Yoonia vestfoldensis]
MPEQAMWVSRALNDMSLIKMFTSNLFETNKDIAIDGIDANWRGESRLAGSFPTELYGKFHDQRFGKLPDFFTAGSHWVMSSTMREVFNRFNLGQTAFYPTRLFQHDRKTLIEGDYCCVSFGEAHRVFVPEESPKLPRFGTHRWKLGGGEIDGDVAVRRSAIPDVDVFLDPQMWEVLFLSDRIVQSLKAAKLTRRLGLRKCRIVQS